MVVRRHEARHDDRARAVDDLGIAGGEVGCDLRDRLSIDQDVGVLEVAYLRIECEHDATAQEDAALASIADQILCLRRRCRLTSTRGCRAARGGRQGRGTCCRRQERAARKRRTRRSGHGGLREMKTIRRRKSLSLVSHEAVASVARPVRASMVWRVHRQLHATAPWRRSRASAH